jgi:transcriptional regulator with XRE-family HTH domain
LDAAKMGATIKRIRLAERRTQQDIATICNLSKSYLSKIEKGSVLPSLNVLGHIADALGTKVSILIAEEESVTVVHESAEHIFANLSKTSMGYSIFPFATGVTKKKVQPFLFVTKKSEHTLNKNSHDDDEFLYILSGEMYLEIGNKKYHLKEGDGIFFDARIEHMTIPISEEVKVLDFFC